MICFQVQSSPCFKHHSSAEVLVKDTGCLSKRNKVLARKGGAPTEAPVELLAEEIALHLCRDLCQGKEVQHRTKYAEGGEEN